MLQKKRLIGLLLSFALVAVLVLAACGDNNDDKKETKKATPTVPPVATEVAAPVVTEAAAPVVTEAAAPVVTEAAAPVVTEVAAPVVTEAAAPAATEEVAMAPAATEEAAPVVTEAAAPAATEEVAMAPAATEEAAPAATEAPTGNEQPLRITLIVNGVLGDKSFFDSAQRGMDRLVSEGYNVEVKTIELGIDPAGWESGLADAMADTDNYDLLIAGTFQMVQFLGARAHQYPDKYFISYDAPVAYDDATVCVDGCKNVYSVGYAQNEGSFLAGVYAGAMTSTDLDGMNADAIIGAMGAQSIPVIDDFIVGYKQGACLVNPDIEVLVQYAGGWNDPAKGKEIALAMYDQKADIVFQIAGGSGAGVFEAAQEQNKYAIGVDSDQASIIADTNEEQAQHILTSMQKNVDYSLYRAVDLHIKGELPYGTTEILGISGGGVSLSDNDIYQNATPDNVKELIAAITESVTNGDITIVSTFAAEPATTTMSCSDMPKTDFDVAQYLGS